MSTKDIVRESNKSTFDDDQLKSITTMDEALAALGSVTDVADWADFGTGFNVLKNKDNLVGVPFVVLEWRFNHSKEFDQEYVAAVVMDEKNNKHILVDGSTGVCAQLRTVTDAKIADGLPYPQAGLIVRNGLTRSDYTKEVDGKEIAASTYYLA